MTSPDLNSSERVGLARGDLNAALRELVNARKLTELAHPLAAACTATAIAVTEKAMATLAQPPAEDRPPAGTGHDRWVTDNYTRLARRNLRDAGKAAELIGEPNVALHCRLAITCIDLLIGEAT